jgi:hypothetical protein
MSLICNKWVISSDNIAWKRPFFAIMIKFAHGATAEIVKPSVIEAVAAIKLRFLSSLSFMIGKSN